MAPEITTLGRHLVNKVLPPDMQDPNRTFGGDEMEALLTRVGKEKPELYKDITHKLVQLGRNAALTEGLTLRLSDTKSPIDRKTISDFVKKQEKVIQTSDMTEAEKDTAMDDLYSKSQKLMEDQTYDAALAANNPFALQVKSKARGSKGQLAGLLSSPSMFRDAKGKLIPVFISRSYSEGLKPWEYYAATYGARAGVVSTKMATPAGGDLGKQLNVMAANLIITQDDCGTTAGVPFPVDDTDNQGAILARDTAGFKAGSIMDGKMAEAIKKQGIDKVLLRSPITCNTKDGLCKLCTGVRESGKLSNLRDNIGVSASSALAERVAQGALNVRHCLSVTTPILYADWSVKELSEVKVGDLIMGCSLEGVMRPVKVLNIFDNGPRECWRTSFIKNGCRHETAERLVVESTLDHKLRSTRLTVGQKDEVLNGKVRILPVGIKSRQFFALTPNVFDDSGFYDEPLALLLGCLLGDGCYTKAVKNIHLVCADVQQVCDLQKYLKPMRLKLTKLKGHDYYYGVNKDGYTNGNNIPNPVKSFLKKSGMYGKYSYEKEIPEVAAGWSNKSTAELIAGLFVTDGSVFPGHKGTPGLALCSTSCKLLKQTRYLLQMRFGILTSELTVTAKAGKDGGFCIDHTICSQHDVWQLTITDAACVRRFYERIPLIGVKRDKLKTLMEKAPTFNHKNTLGFKRTNQEFIGMCPTMDLEVDHPDHLFVLANGLVVSNSGGQKGTQDNYSGVPIINQMVQVPDTFRHRASIATIDGQVDKIEAAPQGGTNIYIGDEVHYVDPQQEVQVKQGDRLEAGDQISSGILNPAEVVQYKGIGEGRKYLAERLTKAFRDSRLSANRRNVEVVARALVNRVDIDDPDGLGDYLPGDSVSYNSVAYSYAPRQDSEMSKPMAAVGRYLEQPALHYTIGTKLTRKMADELDNFQVPQIMVHNDPPGFTPVMERLRGAPAVIGKDWMAKLQGSNLKANLMKDIQYGSGSEIHSTHPVPGLAYGIEFGQSKPGKITY